MYIVIFYTKNTFVYMYYETSIGKRQLVVSRLFAGDNQLSLDFLLVTISCQQTKKSSDNRLSADTSIF